MTKSFATFQMVLLVLLLIGCKPVSKEPQDILVIDSVKSIPYDTTFVYSLQPEDEMLGIGIPEFGDLDSMIERRRIRALVPYTHTFYYIDGKERRGIAFEALNLFEKSLNEQLKFYPPKVRIVFIPVNRSQIIPLLQLGYADLAFAGITITPERQKIVDFSTPTITGLKEIIIGGPSASQLSNLSDLSGKHVFVHLGSSYHSSLKRLNDSLQTVGLSPAQIEPIDPYLEVEDVLGMVHAGVIPYTIMVEDAAKFWATELDGLTLYSDFPISKNISDAWVFRKESPQLIKAANEFLLKNKKGSMIGNMLYNKYLKNKKYLHEVHSASAASILKTTEETFKKYAATYKVDWLLLAAQGYQESGLNQALKSSAGAVGIMQIKPSTAASNPINIEHVEILENNIHAGAKFMRYLIDHYFEKEEMDRLNKELFALAAYNAGPARVSSLRKMAAKKGLNANVWFDNVEIIAAQEIGRETVQYVSNIYKFYTSYRMLRSYSERSGKPVLE